MAINKCMKKLIYLPIVFMIFCLCIWNNFCFLDTLKSLDLAGYSIFCEGDISLKNYDSCVLSGGVKIYSFSGQNISSKIGQKNVLCEQVFLQKNERKNYIKNNHLKLIKSETFDDIKIDYYMCKKLPKYTCINNKKFNIVIAEKSDGVVIGYPAIMGSL